MKKTVMMLLVTLACMAATAIAIPTPTVEVVNTTGNWQINQAGDPGDTFIFTQDIVVNKALTGITDPLVGAYVHLPDMVVGGIGGGPYTLSGGNIRITDSSTPGSETVIYFDGTIEGGDLVAVGTLGLGYTIIQADITNVTINNTIGSSALTVLLYSSPDFQISFTGANVGFTNMLENGLPQADGFSAAITIPEPATVCPCIGDMDDSGQVTLGDLDHMVELLVAEGTPFIVDCPDAHCYCADFDGSGQVTLWDLDAMLTLLVDAGSPFVVPCE